VAYIIYKITNITNSKVYIGLTCKSLEERIGRHVKELQKGRHANKYLQHAWDKYGEDNFKFNEIDSACDYDILNDLEVFYISKYKSSNPDFGYNLTGGGKQERPNKETLLKKIMSSRKVKIAQYSLAGELIRIFDSVKLASRELKVTDSDLHRACKKNFRVKDFLFRKGDSIQNTIEPFNLAERQKSKMKKINQFNLDGSLVKTWDSITAAANAIGAKQATIGNACRKFYKSSGFFWKFVGEEFFIKKNPRFKSVLEILDGVVIRKFPSLKGAAKEIGVDCRILSYKILNKKQVKGYFYEYEKK
jgi:group I intron endonuclease